MFKFDWNQNQEICGKRVGFVVIWPVEKGFMASEFINIKCLIIRTYTFPTMLKTCENYIGPYLEHWTKIYPVLPQFLREFIFLDPKCIIFFKNRCLYSFLAKFFHFFLHFFSRFPYPLSFFPFAPDFPSPLFRFFSKFFGGLGPPRPPS